MIFPETIEIIETCHQSYSAVFHQCESMTSVIFVGSPRCYEIGGTMFYQCKALKTIIIPPLVTYLPYNIFQECSSLEIIIFQCHIKSIDESAFDYNDIIQTVKVYVPDRKSKRVIQSKINKNNIYVMNDYSCKKEIRSPTVTFFIFSLFNIK